MNNQSGIQPIRKIKRGIFLAIGACGTLLVGFLLCFLLLGLAAAQFDLGNMYALGHGVPQDFVLAYKWFDIAKASLQTKNAQYNQIDKGMDDLSSVMTTDQIADAQQAASAWVANHSANSP